jgi:NTE family protein
VRSFALALGGGGARGLAQIAALEVLDELSLRPVAIAGCSVGAAIGAAYAAGMSGKAIRRHVINLAHERGETFTRLMGARAGSLASMLTGLSNPMLLDAEKFCTAFLPPDVPEDFASLTIPLTVVATDLHARCEVTFSSGALKSAVAASMAIPGLLRPVEIEGRVLVDGAAVNPLPFDLLRGAADVVVAIDSMVGPVGQEGIPDAWECLFMTLQVMGQTIIAEKLKQGAPDLLVSAQVGGFRLLEFFRAIAILRAAEPIKAELKEGLRRLLAPAA